MGRSRPEFGHATPRRSRGRAAMLCGPLLPAASPSASSSPSHCVACELLCRVCRAGLYYHPRSGPGIRGTSIGATDAARGTDSQRTSSGRRRGWERARAPARGVRRLKIAVAWSGLFAAPRTLTPVLHRVRLRCMNRTRKEVPRSLASLPGGRDPTAVARRRRTLCLRS